VALHEVASAWAGDRTKFQIKWPNDLMVGPAKLAGILLERSGDAIVIGFGVNLANHPQQLERATASFAALGAGTPEPAAFLDDLAAAFARWLQIWRGQGLAPIVKRWTQAAHPIGTPVMASGEEGLFGGLTAEGALRLRRRDGSEVAVLAGDVFLL
jgi:BirA family transcriptional regulator, biotin operon repressor / biotin---[acetyl-CoA-carboxylase] ligase